MIWFLLSAAFAQAEPVGVPDLNTQLFRPSVDARSTLWTDDLRGGTDGWSSRVLLHYVDEPLSFRYDTGGSVPVVNGVAMGNVLAGWGNDRVRFGLDVPVVLSAEGIARSGEFGLGDVVLHGRATFLQPADEDGTALGATVRYGLPTATTLNPLGDPLGDVDVAFVLDTSLAGPVRLLANLGLGSPLGVELDEYKPLQVRGRAALTADLTPTAGLAFEVASRQNLGDVLKSRLDTREGLVGGYVRTGSATLRAAIGTSLWADGIGSSDLRAVLGADWGSQPPPPDTDGDGIADPSDACRTEAEDLDGVLDDDGCPDPTPRVVIGAVDGDGQPVDARVRVMMGGEPKGTQDAGKQWELQPGDYQITIIESDGREVEQALVVAATDVERTVQVPTEVFGHATVVVTGYDGLPVKSARFFHERKQVGRGDQTTLRLPVGRQTVVVRAPGYRPTRTAVTVLEDGVSTKSITMKAARARFSGDRLVLDDKVYFTTGAASLDPKSHSLLDEIAGLLIDNPEVLQVRVEGHTDTQGDDDANLTLSQERADAVVAYLVQAGVAADRLVAKGFGETEPVAQGDSPEAHEQNRRVAFVVTKQAR
jgi:outer membrane protein OmpA-like peptidoglycan-associated protein